jgi:hypothetical protein
VIVAAVVRRWAALRRGHGVAVSALPAQMTIVYSERVLVLDAVHPLGRRVEHARRGGVSRRELARGKEDL